MGFHPGYGQLDFLSVGALFNGGGAGGGGYPNYPIFYIAATGSSSTTQTSNWSPNSNIRATTSESYLHCALRRLQQALGVVRDKRIGVGYPGAYHFGVAGSTITSLSTANTVLAAITSCANAGNAVLVYQIGRNDLQAGLSAQQILNSAKVLFDLTESYGVRYIACEDYPHTYFESGPDERVILPQRLAYNTLLSAECAARGVPLCKWGNLGEDPNRPGYLLSSYGNNVRPGHPRITLAEEMGQELAHQLSSNFLLTTPDLYTLTQYSLPINWQLTGAEGVRPTGWSTGNGSGVTHTWTKIPYGDGTGRNWFRLSAASGGSVNSAQAFVTSAISGVEVGDMIQGVCEVRFPVLSSWQGGGYGLSMFIVPGFQGANEGIPSMALSAPPVPFRPPGGKMVLRTMYFPAPSAGSVGFQMHFYGSGVVDWGTPLILKNANVLSPNQPASWP